ncbi:MAG TPA: serine dehydratase [Planctomycetaceae bacterium]|nr:serine dehydratase [Planctomycetaceae bacterium]|tara:strand:+ start:840 stop:1790 length:951 start_codon:yes stop_codon:yes gene_type:complete
MDSEIDISAAATRLNGVANKTPILRSRLLDEMVGAQIYLKAEHLQRTGAFKFRGAFNAVAALNQEVRSKGVVSYSSGNHAQALARAAQIFRIPATIVMPSDAPQSKREATEAYGAGVVEYDRYAQKRESIAEELRKEHKLTLIPPFDDPYVIAGQSTCGQELMEQTDHLDQVIVAVGGGGLIAGTALAIQQRNPKCQIIGVEPEKGNDVQRSLAAGAIIEIAVPETIADGQQTTSAGVHTFPIIQKYVDEIVTVTDEQIIEAMVFLFKYQNQVVEPSGASSLAAVLNDKTHSKGKRVGVIISGGNISPERFFALTT